MRTENKAYLTASVSSAALAGFSASQLMLVNKALALTIGLLLMIPASFFGAIFLKQAVDENEVRNRFKRYRSEVDLP